MRNNIPNPINPVGLLKVKPINTITVVQKIVLIAGEFNPNPILIRKITITIAPIVHNRRLLFSRFANNDFSSYAAKMSLCFANSSAILSLSVISEA